MNQNGDMVEKALEIAADMQKMDNIPDELSDIIKECVDDELSEDDLDYVSAASALPEQSFRQFMEKLVEHRNK